MNPRESLTNGAIGVLSSLAAAGVTMTEFEQWLRVAGGVVALFVGILTAINLLRNKINK